MLAFSHLLAESKPQQFSSQPLARIIFDTHGDQRADDDDLARYQINPEGLITAADLARAEAALDPGLFFLDKKTDDDERKARRKVLTNKALAALALNRILGHEAVKRKIAPNVSSERVDYAVRMVLVQNMAVHRKTNLSAEEIRQKTNLDLFLELQKQEQESRAQVEAEGKKEKVLRFDFPIDWNASDKNTPLSTVMLDDANPLKHAIGVRNDFENLSPDRPWIHFGWPLIKLSFHCKKSDTGGWTSCFGKSLSEFEDLIRSYLQGRYRVMLRQHIWHQLISELIPTEVEVQKFYDRVREPLFIIAPQKLKLVKVFIISADAELAKSYETAVVEKIKKKSEVLAKTLEVRIANSKMTNAEKVQELFSLRAPLLKELQSEMTKVDLRKQFVEVRIVELERSKLDPGLLEALDPVRLFPVATKEQGFAKRVYYFPIDPIRQYAEATSSQVEKTWRQMQYAELARKLASKLLEDNLVHFDNEILASSLGSVDLLFPEIPLVVDDHRSVFVPDSPQTISTSNLAAIEAIPDLGEK